MDELTLIQTDNWSPLFKRYNQYVLACCDFNEDMAQEIWYRIILKKDQFFYGSFKAWVSQISNSVKTDAYRKKTKNWVNTIPGREKKHPPIKEYPMDSPFMCKVFAEIPDDFPVRKEEKEMFENKLKSILQVVDQLPEKQRDVIILRSCKSFSEIADIMGDSLNASLQRMHCAKKRIRSIIKNQTIAA